MNDAEKQRFHFNSNIRSKSGSKASMSNNEDRYLRALEIQELKREIREEELEKQRVIEEAEKAAAEEKARQEAEEKAAEEETAKKAEQVEETAEPVAEESASVVESPAPAKPTGSFVPGPTPRKDFSSSEKAAMLKRAKAHAAEVAKKKGK